MVKETPQNFTKLTAKAAFLYQTGTLFRIAVKERLAEAKGESITHAQTLRMTLCVVLSILFPFLSSSSSLLIIESEGMRIKYIVLLAIAIIGFLTISHFTEGRSYYFKHTDSTNLSNESFGKVRLHDNIHNPSFVKHYGIPLSRDDNDLYDYYHWEDGLVTASIIKGKEKGDIVRLIIGKVEEGVKTKTSLKTAKGIVIGSTKQDVIDSYGSKYYTRSEQGVDIVGYVDHKLGATMEFWLVEDGKVAEIRIDDTNIE